MKRKRKISFVKSELDKEWYGYYDYSYKQIEDGSIIDTIYRVLEKNNFSTSILSYIKLTSSLFYDCYIELKCDKQTFNLFCKDFVISLKGYISNIKY